MAESVTFAARAAAWAALSSAEVARAAFAADQAARHSLVTFLRAAGIATPAGGFYTLCTSDLVALAETVAVYRVASQNARGA